MPVYEYVCRGCGHPFEELVLGGEEPECPKCAGRELEKQFSTFAAGKASAATDSPGPGACGTCGDPRGPGACSLPGDLN